MSALSIRGLLLALAETVAQVLFFYMLYSHIVPPFMEKIFPTRAQTTRKVKAYLSQSFRDPDRVLRGMAEGNCLLSGSRAVEVVAGSATTPESDWDFFTYCSPYCVGPILRDFSAAGVVWDDAYQPIRDILGLRPGESRRIHKDDLRAFVFRADVDRDRGVTIPTHVAGVIDEFDDCLLHHPQRRVLHLNCGVSIQIVHGLRDQHYDALVMHKITGRTTHNSTNQIVQLIFAPNMTPIQHIMNYYASSVQAFVSPFAIAHFYWLSALRRHGYMWLNNTQHEPSTRRALQKYSERAWTFSLGSPRETVIDRCLRTSWFSRYQRLSFSTGLPQQLHDVRAAAFDRIRWQESESETRFVPVVPPSLRRVLDTNRKDRLLAGTRSQATTDLFRLAVQHTAAFTLFGSYKHENELVGL